MLIRTWDDDGSHEIAVATLPPRLSTDEGDHWAWTCDCGHHHLEDEAQVEGILECDKCGKQFVDMDE